MARWLVYVPWCGLLATLLAGCGEGEGGQWAATSLSVQSSRFAGSLTASGWITVPSGTTGPVQAALALTDARGGHEFASPDYGDELFLGTVAFQNGALPFAVRNLAPGSYLVSFVVDSNGDDVVGEGDLGGYYAAAAETAVSRGRDAHVVELTTSRSDLSFTLGPLECLAGLGDSCSVDSDCRGTTCSYPSGNTVGYHAGACSEAGLCEAVVTNCPEVNGEPGTASTPECLAAPPNTDRTQ